MKQKTNDEIDNHLANQAKQLFLKKILQDNRFAELDGLNEYDEDFSFFTDRGNLIPVEMREALARLQKENSDPAMDIAENTSEQQGQDDSKDV
jgi:hypothetical protein